MSSSSLSAMLQVFAAMMQVYRVYQIDWQRNAPASVRCLNTRGGNQGETRIGHVSCIMLLVTQCSRRFDIYNIVGDSKHFEELYFIFSVLIIINRWCTSWTRSFGSWNYFNLPTQAMPISAAVSKFDSRRWRMLFDTTLWNRI